jgi:general secretion pathway protein I
MMCTKRRVEGYTLVEVLVAMMILALALTVLMRIFSGGLRNLSVSADYGYAVVLAEAQLAAAGSSEALVPGETRSSDDKFRWTRTIEEYRAEEFTEMDKLPVTAFQVTVVVEWPNVSRTRQLNLSTIKLRRSQGTGK